MPHTPRALQHAQRRVSAPWRRRLGTLGLALAAAAIASAATSPPAAAAPSPQASAPGWTYITDAVAHGRLEATTAKGRELLDRLVIEPGTPERLELYRAVTSAELLLITSTNAAVPATDLEEARTDVAAATEVADAAQEVAVDAQLAQALADGEAQLAAWEAVGTDLTRLERLRSAVTAAQGLPDGANQQARINAAAELATRTAEIPTITSQSGPTTVGGIVVANKSLPLPADYAPGLLPEVSAAFAAMQAAAAADGISLWIDSGYRSYLDQQITYDGYANRVGTDLADNFSSRPGHSEHQTGLAIDVNNAHPDFAGTAEATWLAQHAAEYGFVIRYPEGKTEVTGYTYEPWHLRYLGVDLAQQLTAQGLTLEEYLGITSSY